jgi:DNA mismatch repair protein MutS
MTPMMQQYLAIKEQYKDALLFFRLGDFYEMFHEDAQIGSRALEIVLTSRGKGTDGIPMCGIPYHSADLYIAKLIEKGYKIAICEQVEDPKLAKGIVKREVIKVITPGTVLDDKILDEKRNNYLMSLVVSNYTVGLAYLDITIGDIFITSFDLKKMDFNTVISEITRIFPAECIIDENIIEFNLIKLIKKQIPSLLISKENLPFKEAEDINHYILNNLSKIDPICLVEAKTIEYQAAALLIAYLLKTQKTIALNINKIETYTINDYMMIDSQTRRNLELTTSLRNNKQGTLLNTLDATSTSMGGRMLKLWLEQPLINKQQINARLEATKELIDHALVKQKITEQLKDIYDLERLISKIAFDHINPREIIALKTSLKQINPIKDNLKICLAKQIKEISDGLYNYDSLISLIEAVIHDNPPITFKEGGIIKDGYNSDIDKLRKATSNGKQWIAELEAKEKDRTGIKSLKIRYNKVFGYYIEITNSNLANVPTDYIRKQTLVNAERFITPELKELEDMLLNSTVRLYELEYNTFNQLRDTIKGYINQIKVTAHYIATLDVICSSATIALNRQYVMPKMDASRNLILEGARHPVVEALLNREDFIANNCAFNIDQNTLSIITGPNMAGKSTYIRTVAIIIIMAQAGFYVPAKYANIGIVDKVFARVGASDDIATGQSTFMVEMNEVANILNNATDRSMIILDEVGRGTSTYDGLSIAWAICEYIVKNIQAKTLFATHYHELIELENLYPHIKNYSMAVKEQNNSIVFLRQVIEGGTDKSYGIYVAKLAGLPESVLAKAKKKIKDLENQIGMPIQAELNFADQGSMEALLREPLLEIVDNIKKMDVNDLTPLQALNLLSQYQSEIKKVEGNYEKD